MATFYAVVGGSVFVWIGLSWLITKLVGITGVDSYILWAGLSVIGIAAAAVVTWWRMRSEGAGIDLPPELAAASGNSGTDELDTIVRDAEAKLAASRMAGGNIGNLPLVFIVGDSGSTKTSAVVHSGLEPELLAGQVYGDNNAVVPTRTANLWLGGGTVLAEAGPAVLADAGRWVRLVRRLRPGNLKSVVGGQGQAPRAALVCVNAEIFTLPGAADNLATLGRTLSERLGNISQALGVSFPVYVLFTRVDRLPFFLDYVRTLSNDEASQVFGATLPLRTDGGGIYAEEESRRLSAAFDGLFHSLADRRVEFLPRESDGGKIPGAYEFPREFRKLRGPLTQFLVDLCRPSQLRTSPFLRGFYFSGVRPVVITENAVAPAPLPRESRKVAGSATGMFQVPSSQSTQQPTGAPQYTTRRVPQWVFLPHLFQGIVTRDQAALGASVASTKTSSAQRILLASAAALCLLLTLFWTLSFFQNRQLIGTSVAATEAIPAAEAAGENLASLDALQRLETLRAQLELLTRYKAEGHPFAMGMGLYAGDALYPEVRKAYYSRFAQLLFRQAQSALVAHLGGLPALPAPTDNYGLTYEILKGYMITTAASERTSDASPAPILLSRWAEGRNPDATRMQLADRQFRFYARDLKNGNPFSSSADTGAVERGRTYLSKFSGAERVYQFMLSSAGKATANFNRDVKDSAQAVVNNRDVSGAFTKAGFAFMSDALRRADQFFGGEKWVLCDSAGNIPSTSCATGNIDPAKLTADLSARYVNDFIAQWRNYFKVSSVLRYADLKDASRKLNLQAGPQSPILGLFWLASQNTAIDPKKVTGGDRITSAFQVVHAVVPPGQSERYVSPASQPYHSALGQLQAAIDAAANMPTPDPVTVSSALASATAARAALRQVAQNFNIDGEAHLEQTAQKLLEDPITNAEGLLRGLGPRELNGKGAGLCSQMGPILNKYPFNPTSPNDATLAEVNQILKPGEGALWSFYELNLRQALAKQGAQYVPTGQIPLNPTFLAFFNNMARFSDALYKNGPEPKLSYTVRPLKSDGIENLVLTIDGQKLPASSGGGKQFSWPGNSQGARFSGKVGSSDLPSAPYEGLWAAFRLFNDAETFEPAGTGYNLEWILQLRFGKSQTATANAPRARYFVDLGGAPLLFRKTGAAVRCVSVVAR